MEDDLTRPAEVPGKASKPARKKVRQRTATVPPPEIDRLLNLLMELNGAIAIGAMPAKEASLIQKNIQTVLDTQMKRANQKTAGPTQEGLVELCRKDPKNLNAIAAFLTDEQFEMLTAEFGEDDDEEV